MNMVNLRVLVSAWAFVCITVLGSHALATERAEKQLSIVVVNAQGTPLEGALVSLLSSQDFQLPSYGTLNPDPFESVPAGTDWLVSTADGSVDFERPREPSFLYGKFEAGGQGSFGLLEISTPSHLGDDALRLVLRSSESTAIRVIDSHGVGLEGIPVEVFSAENSAMSYMDPGWRTSPKGDFVLRNASLQLKGLLGDQLKLKLSVMGDAAVVPIELGVHATGPVMIKLADRVDLKFEVVNYARPDLKNARIDLYIRCLDDGHSGQQSLTYWGSAKGAEFRSLPIGRDYQVWGFLGADRIRGQVNVSTRATDGDLLVVKMTFGLPRWHIKGRLLDGRGQAWSRQTFSGSMNGCGFGPFQTDKDGSFAISLGEGYDPRPGEPTGEVQLRINRPNGVTARATAALVPDPSRKDSGSLSCGDVVVVNDPILLSGKVVDQNGRGLEGIAVAAAEVLWDPKTKAIRLDEDGHPIYVNIWDAKTRTSKGGDFSLRNFKEVKLLLLMVSDETYELATPWRCYSAGEKQVTVKLVRSAKK